VKAQTYTRLLRSQNFSFFSQDKVSWLLLLFPRDNFETIIITQTFGDVGGDVQ
jgi:hypothetical protein